MQTQSLVLGLLGQAVLLAAIPLRAKAVIERRDNLEIIETALAPVFSSLRSVDAAVLALDGTPTTANNLLTVSQQNEVIVNQAILDVRATGDLSATKSLKLRQTTDELASQTKLTLDDLVVRKPILDKLGVSNVALQNLQQQQISSLSLSDALAEKVPKVGQKQAAADKGNLQSILSKAVAAYSVPATPMVPATAVPPPVTPISAAPPQLISLVGPKDKKKKKKAKGNRHDVDTVVEDKA
ncbi:cell wall protein [Colletotrichum incanum]|uniref:Cell wall protein n=1 Tax=Colletotrichum incanum TaxID=1573173 RepID=A0A167A527_COLIC|nr:cell wall protein [Colletotrichum incanum]OHW98290.1 cell wall protein [Colletotrichum incanum]